jgi:hypothetical protein
MVNVKTSDTSLLLSFRYLSCLVSSPALAEVDDLSSSNQSWIKSLVISLVEWIFTLPVASVYLIRSARVARLIDDMGWKFSTCMNDVSAGPGIPSTGSPTVVFSEIWRWWQGIRLFSPMVNFGDLSLQVHSKGVRGRGLKIPCLITSRTIRSGKDWKGHMCDRSQFWLLNIRRDERNVYSEHYYCGPIAFHVLLLCLMISIILWRLLQATMCGKRAQQLPIGEKRWSGHDDGSKSAWVWWGMSTNKAARLFWVHSMKDVATETRRNTDLPTHENFGK